MTKKTTASIEEKIIKTALSLAAEHGWNDTTLDDIAQKAKISLAELEERYSDKTAILIAYSRMIDDQVAQAAGKPDTELPPRDRLFDVMMERFDALNEQRDGVCAVLSTVKCQPKDALCGLPHLARSMERMLETAGLETDNVLKTAGLTLIYLKMLWIWRSDDSPDMAKTMAALDKSLGYAETFVNNFSMMTGS